MELVNEHVLNECDAKNTCIYDRNSKEDYIKICKENSTKIDIDCYIRVCITEHNLYCLSLTIIIILFVKYLI